MENKFDIHDTFLGRQTTNPDKYDASLLFRIPRLENRIKYNIKEELLPFTGYDVWNCYEVSFLTKKGLPVSRVVKIIYPAESKYLVESKSLKLYLNSFNMEYFENSIQESEKSVLETITTDLQNLLNTDLKVIFFNTNSISRKPFTEIKIPDIVDLISLEKLESIPFTHFEESPELLKGEKTNCIQEINFHSDLLRSNCRVTNQPDWGDLFVRMKTFYKIDLCTVTAYLISFRKENHFHEEVVEMIYKRFYDIFEPQKLMVAAMYTRRGGIDINPVRASHADWIDETFISSQYRLEKTLRQ